MREVLIGSPSVASAFGVQTLHSSGLSQAARPPAALRRRALRWHRHYYHVGQPCGCSEVFVRGLASQAPPSCASRLRAAPCSTARLCLYPGDRFTLEHPNTIDVARWYGRILRLTEATGKGRGPFIPWL